MSINGQCGKYISFERGLHKSMNLKRQQVKLQKRICETTKILHMTKDFEGKRYLSPQAIHFNM
jgi:hypothetical protein